MGCVLGVWWTSAAALWAAESRPLKKLPADVLRWSTAWVEIPKQVYEIGQDYGPVAAVTWGPTKGTAMMVGSTTKELWNATKPDKRPAHSPSQYSKHKHPTGPLFRYEF